MQTSDRDKMFLQQRLYLQACDLLKFKVDMLLVIILYYISALLFFLHFFSACRSSCLFLSTSSNVMAFEEIIFLVFQQL